MLDHETPAIAPVAPTIRGQGGVGLIPYTNNISLSQDLAANDENFQNDPQVKHVFKGQKN